jgi:hypothetical protein
MQIIVAGYYNGVTLVLKSSGSIVALDFTQDQVDEFTTIMSQCVNTTKVGQIALTEVPLYCQRKKSK